MEKIIWSSLLVSNGNAACMIMNTPHTRSTNASQISSWHKINFFSNWQQKRVATRIISLFFLKLNFANVHGEHTSRLVAANQLNLTTLKLHVHTRVLQVNNTNLSHLLDSLQTSGKFIWFLATSIHPHISPSPQNHSLSFLFCFVFETACFFHPELSQTISGF